MLPRVLNQEALVELIGRKVEAARRLATRQRIQQAHGGQGRIDIATLQGQSLETLLHWLQIAGCHAKGHKVRHRKAPAHRIEGKIHDLVWSVGDEDHAHIRLAILVHTEVESLEGGLEFSRSVGKGASGRILNKGVAKAVFTEQALFRTLFIGDEVRCQQEITLFLQRNRQFGTAHPHGLYRHGEVPDAELDDDPLIGVTDLAQIHNLALLIGGELPTLPRTLEFVVDLLERHSLSLDFFVRTLAGDFDHLLRLAIVADAHEIMQDEFAHLISSPLSCILCPRSRHLGAVI